MGPGTVYIYILYIYKNPKTSPTWNLISCSCLEEDAEHLQGYTLEAAVGPAPPAEDDEKHLVSHGLGSSRGDGPQQSIDLPEQVQLANSLTCVFLSRL